MNNDKSSPYDKQVLDFIENLDKPNNSTMFLQDDLDSDKNNKDKTISSSSCNPSGPLTGVTPYR